MYAVCFPSLFPQVYVIHTTWSDRCRFEIYRRYTEFRTFQVSHCITQLYNTFTVTHFDASHFREPSIGYFQWRLGNISPVVEFYQVFKVSLACLGFMCLVHLHPTCALKGNTFARARKVQKIQLKAIRDYCQVCHFTAT